MNTGPSACPESPLCRQMRRKAVDTVPLESTCSAHHCDRSECADRTHVRTVRCTGTLWDKVAAKAAAMRIDTNAGVTQALEAWVSQDA